MFKRFRELRVSCFWGWVALLVLYLVSSAISESITLHRYKTVFTDIQHPPGTWLVDSLALRVEYYPATYVEDSIHFQSAYLVGELRRYSADWKSIPSFYENQTLFSDGLSIPVGIWAVNLDPETGDLSVNTDQELAVGRGYAFDPFTEDALDSITDQYRLMLPRDVQRDNHNLYLVYSIWHTEK